MMINLKTVTMAAAVVSVVAIAIKQNESELLSIKGALEVRSSIPGRMRLYSPKIKDASETLAQLEQLQTNNIATEISVNPITKTVLIIYNKNAIEADVLFGVVMKLLEVEKKEISKVGTALKSVTNCVDYLVQDKSKGLINLTQAIAGAFIGVGMRQYSRGNFTVPNGATLFWWAYSMLRKSGSNA